MTYFTCFDLTKTEHVWCKTVLDCLAIVLLSDCLALRYNSIQYSTVQYNTYDKYQYVYTIALHNKISTIILFLGINGILVKLYT